MRGQKNFDKRARTRSTGAGELPAMGAWGGGGNVNERYLPHRGRGDGKKNREKRVGLMRLKKKEWKQGKKREDLGYNHYSGARKKKTRGY